MLMLVQGKLKCFINVDFITQMLLFETRAQMFSQGTGICFEVILEIYSDYRM